MKNNKYFYTKLINFGLKDGIVYNLDKIIFIYFINDIHYDYFSPI